MTAAEAAKYGLLPRDLFPDQMPRYPNLWFRVHRTLPAREKYMEAVRWLVGLLERELDLRDTSALSGVESSKP